MPLFNPTRARAARRTVALTALLAAPLALAQDAAEPLWIKPKLEPGQTMRFEIAFDLALLQKRENAEAREINRMQGGVIELKVDEVGPDGSALVSAKVDRIALTVKENGEDSATYTSVGDAPQGDDAPAWAGLGKMLTEAEISFAVTPEGKVESVSGLTEFANAAFEAAPGADLAGLFAPQVFARTVEPVFSIDGAAGSRRVIGRGWQTVENVNLGAVGVMDITHDFKLVTIEDDRAIIMGIPTVQVRRPTQPGEGVAQVAVDDSTGYTRIEYAPEDQQLALREQVIRLATTWTLGQPDAEGYIKIEQVQNSKSTLKRLED